MSHLKPIHPGITAGFIAACFLILILPSEAADYLKDIKPVLKERCYSCHGALKQKGNLRVDTAAQMLAAKVIVPDSAEQSELVRRVTSQDDDERMPPEGHALTDSQISRLREWIESGAPHPENEAVEDDPRSHWSFQPIAKPPVPQIEGITHPVDAFLAVKQQEKGVIVQPSPERSILLRRIYLDLTGLQPTRPQLDDERSWETIVDELLASPQHGERWGRHWMDVWRYSDWYGLGKQLRYSQKHLWHWRDWIVESLNEDKGYDQMIHEMLAGDELAPEDPDTLRATGFLARNYYLFNRTTWLDSTVEHTGKAFVGLTINCAKCHDHKYDPIDFEDYYRFRAIFEPHQVRLDPVPGETDFEKNGLPRIFDEQLDAPTFLHLRGDPAQEDKETKIEAAVPAFLSQFAPTIQPVSLPSAAFAPGSQAFAQHDRLKQARAKVTRAQAALEKARNISTPSKVEKVATSDFLLEDDFSSPRPEVWEIKGAGLKYTNGALEQTSPSREPGRLISQSPLPRDFEMVCRYTATGGPKFKSITFRFDYQNDGKHANFIYTSEDAGGPKVQAAFTRNGKTSYPGDGRTKKQDATGRPQELRIAVRGRLANVWLDGKFILAYQFPDRIAAGHLSISAFDATARFHAIKITALPEEIKLSNARNKPVPESKIDEQKRCLRIAELDLKAAQAEEQSLEATIAADTARYRKQKPDRELERTALRLQIAALKSKATHDLALYQDGDAKKLKAAKALEKLANDRLEEFEEGNGSYEPLRASRKSLETPEHKETDYPPVYPNQSTGRRTMLAEWLTSPENPLTARVAVNHVWLRHFGEALVPTVFDFGRQAPQPIHSELLDYLATEFVESGWSLRHLHRLLVTSQAYQRSSSRADAAKESLVNDPDNLLYWRMNPRRMESQLVRDNLLHLSAKLDLKMGGPSLDSGNAGNRRSLYFTHSPDKIDPFLRTFDDADLLQCYRRSESVVPQQALALSNSKLALESSRLIAGKIGINHEPEQFIDLAFRTVLSRPPLPAETSECLQFLDELDALADKARAADSLRSRSQLIHALLNHNDFVTIR
ncbi:MAG: PSD1 and planctomycete cytochrome C domain-containing protein [Verrucomicrobiales bacterium]|nr:PSD1 and planctomycete cytochrome C domain-containing protein [Verrucomicrobiales bacterium]